MMSVRKSSLVILDEKVLQCCIHFIHALRACLAHHRRYMIPVITFNMILMNGHHSFGFIIKVVLEFFTQDAIQNIQGIRTGCTVALLCVVTLITIRDSVQGGFTSMHPAYIQPYLRFLSFQTIHTSRST